MTKTRKPEPIKEVQQSAYEVLNQFLKDNDIVLGLGKSQISYTDSNQIIISPPTIFAIYKDEVTKKEGN